MECGGETMEGFLEKRRETVSFLWRRYWFRLSGGKLSYFKSRDSTIPHGQIDLNNMKTMGELTSTGKNFSFEIVLSPLKTIILAADSEEERRLWMDTLFSKSPSVRRVSSQQKPVSPQRKTFSTIWYTAEAPADTLAGGPTLAQEDDAMRNRDTDIKQPEDFTMVAKQATPEPTQKLQPRRAPPKIPQRPPNLNIKPPPKTPPLPPKLPTLESQGCSSPSSSPSSSSSSSPSNTTLETLTTVDSHEDDDVPEEVIYDTPRPYPDILQDND